MESKKTFFRSMWENLFACLCGNILYFLSYLVPQNKDIWIFGAWFGRKYAGNSKYLFEYVVKNHPEVRAVWLSESKKVLDVIRSKRYEAYSTYNLKGYWLSMRGKVGVVCVNNVVDLNRYVTNGRTKIVQLSHGIPLKKIGFDDRIFTFDRAIIPSLKRFLIKYFFPFFRKRDSLVIATSEENKQKFRTAFNVQLHKIKVTGFPRNDALFLLTGDKPDRDIVSGIYMPTFRGGLWSKFNLFEKYGFDVEKLEDFLRKKNVYLYLKLHPVNSLPPRLLRQIRESKFIILYEADEVYGSLSKFSFLITDYSSVYFDYLLLDRPIIFTPFDMEDYVKKEREFYYKYDDVTPGPKAKDWNEVLKYIEESIADPDKYKSERKRIRKMFHKYCDGHSSERVYQEIIKLL